MLYYGVDPHKKVHVVSLCDVTGKRITEHSFKANPEGYQAMFEFAVKHSNERLWGIENPQSYGKGLAQFLVSKGENVLAVSPHLTGRYRRRSNSRAKTDNHDSLAVARALLQETEKLPPVLIETDTQILSLLIEHYDNLKSESLKIVNRLHAALFTLNPDYEEIGNLTLISTISKLLKMAQPEQSGIKGTYWQIIISLSERLVHVFKEMKSLVKQMEQHLELLQAQQLLEVKGIGPYLAAKIISIVGNPTLFRNESAFANYAGVAPIPCSSGKTENYRVNPGGNRQLNYAIHTIALSKIRYEQDSKDYYLKKRAEGKTSKEAKRCLKRQVAKKIFKLLLQIKSINKMA